MEQWLLTGETSYVTKEWIILQRVHHAMPLDARVL